MNNVTKKIIAVFSVVLVAMSSLAGCGDKKENSNSGEAMTQYALEIGSADNNNPLTSDPGIADEDTTKSESPTESDPEESEITTEVEVIEDVTDAEGQPVTEVVIVTDEAGEPATNAAGETVTETVKVTTVVKKTEKVTQTTTTAPAAKYEPKQDGRYAMWLDISKDENFYFEGDFLHIVFKVKENIPDGDYKFRISPDLSDVAGVAVHPSKVIDGTIRVNNGSIDPVDVSGETGMVFYGDNIACKQGDTIDYYMNIKNNTGLVAFVIWFYFDSNALEFVSAEASGEYEEIAKKTEVGAGRYNDID